MAPPWGIMRPGRSAIEAARPAASDMPRAARTATQGQSMTATSGRQVPRLFSAGLFHSPLMLLPPIVLAVRVTEIFFELTSYFLIDTRHWLAVLGVVPLLLALILRPLRAGRGTWAERDRADRRLGGWLALAVVSLLAVPLLKWLGDAVNHDATWVYRNIAKFFHEQGELGVRSWL